MHLEKERTESLIHRVFHQTFAMSQHPRQFQFPIYLLTLVAQLWSFGLYGCIRYGFAGSDRCNHFKSFPLETLKPSQNSCYHVSLSGISGLYALNNQIQVAIEPWDLSSYSVFPLNVRNSRARVVRKLDCSSPGVQSQQNKEPLPQTLPTGSHDDPNSGF